MTRVVLFREIEPDDGVQCSGRCPWREGELCTLFVAQLVPAASSTIETQCVRSDECVTSEKRGVAWKRWNQQSAKENAA